jgi:hypothetical protein
MALATLDNGLERPGGEAGMLREKTGETVLPLPSNAVVSDGIAVIVRECGRWGRVFIEAILLVGLRLVVGEICCEVAPDPVPAPEVSYLLSSCEEATVGGMSVGKAMQ